MKKEHWKAPAKIMKKEEINMIIDELETVRIYVGAEMGRLCNSNQHIEACVFQSVRDSIAQNINLLKSYAYCKSESEEKEWWN